MLTVERIFKLRTLIIGTTPLTGELIEKINSWPPSRYSVIGVVSESKGMAGWHLPCPILGTIEDLQRIVDEQRPERIVIALRERRRRLPVRQLVDARINGRIQIEDGHNLYERLTGKLAIDLMTPSSLIFSQNFRPSPAARAIARIISLLAACIGLVVSAPLYGLIAAAIRLDSRGPVLFTQERIGLGGRSFKILKFRTMHEATGLHTEWARDNDDRITRVGRLLRKYRLDELPQFINILQGDMNLVGPRPHPVSNYEVLEVVSRNLPECGEPIPYYALRCTVRPGITGWAQVRYRYANDLIEEIEKLRYDLYYIKHYSLWMDLRILFETVRIVLLGRSSGETVSVRQPVTTVKKPVSIPEAR
jgi:exopolysaccharide biosynthesis polyprenyl glycosylphosphotransferase